VVYRALTDVLLGHGPPAKAGDILPDTYPNMDGNPVPVDFDRLLEAGLVEEAQDENLDALTRPELDELAAGVGVEDPGKLANKQAVIDAIEAARKRA
jgi:hypothetical protein